MLMLINDKRLMGKFTNSRLFNTIAWIAAVILILLALILVLLTIFPGIFPQA
jgi:Mn2+/Fe2+ NRAMP family transporter